MIRLRIDEDQEIEQPSSDDILASITKLDSGESRSINVIRADEENAFTKAIRLQPGLFLLEYSDSYGHMAADDTFDQESLAEVLIAYANGGTEWLKNQSWTPVEI